MIMRIELVNEINEELLNDFVNKINSLPNDVKEITLVINSEGGEVSSGLKFLSHIDNLKKKGIKVIAEIQYQAASMAADIAMACDTVKINKYGMIMFHAAHAGGAKLSESEQQYLEKQSEMLLNMVADKRNLNKEKIEDYYDLEFWFKPEEAKEVGFVDEIINDELPEFKKEFAKLYKKAFNGNNLTANKLNNSNSNTIKKEIIMEENEIKELTIEEVMTMVEELKEEVEKLKSAYKSEDKEEEVEKAYDDKEDKEDEEIEKIVKEAFNSGKINDKNLWKSMFKINKETAIKALNDIQPKKTYDYKSITPKTSNKTWKELSKNNPKELLEIKKTNWALFSKLHKDEFGIEPIK